VFGVGGERVVAARYGAADRDPGSAVGLLEPDGHVLAVEVVPEQSAPACVVSGVFIPKDQLSITRTIEMIAEVSALLAISTQAGTGAERRRLRMPLSRCAAEHRRLYERAGCFRPLPPVRLLPPVADSGSSRGT